MILDIKTTLIDLPEEIIRTTFDPERLRDLAESIREIGLLQPIVVKKKADRFELIAGYRRFTAHELIGKKKILAVVMEEDYDMVEAAAITENIQREQLAPLDEARAIRVLVDVHGWGIMKTARKLGRSEGWVRGRLDLLSLPQTIASLVQGEKIGIAVAIELAKIPDEKIRDQYAIYAAEAGCTAATAANWRRQVERDIEAGVMPEATPGGPDEERLPVRMMIACDSCDAGFDAVRVRILRLCPTCFNAWMAA